MIVVIIPYYDININLIDDFVISISIKKSYPDLW